MVDSWSKDQEEASDENISYREKQPPPQCGTKAVRKRRVNADFSLFPPSSPALFPPSSPASALVDQT